MALALAGAAGATIPMGAALALWRVNILSDWAKSELRHGVIAFGAGALLAAVALVLVPEGSARLQPIPALAWFCAGSLFFAGVTAFLATRKGPGAQFMAMMMDYLPEAMALGALVTGHFETALLVAALIALQNLPEGFNAMREMTEHAPDRRKPNLLLLFCAMVPLGPLAAGIGMALPAAYEPVLGAVMMLSAGGILYLMFQDIAPQVRLEASWLPPFGAIAGFALGLAGHLLI